MASMLKKIPWGSHHEEEKPTQTQEEGESLTTILRTAEDRAALTILVADCMEVMRQGVVDVFDARQTGRTTTATGKEEQSSSESTTDDQAEAEKLKRTQRSRLEALRRLAWQLYIAPRRSHKLEKRGTTAKRARRAQAARCTTSIAPDEVS